MKKIFIVYLFTLFYSIYGQSTDTDYFIDLQVVSYAQNNAVYLYNLQTDKTETINFDSKKYTFSGTYLNGEILLFTADGIDNKASFWFTKNMQLIGLCGNYRGNYGVSFYSDYPDSDRCYVTNEIYKYSLSAIRISRSELVITFPFPSIIHTDIDDNLLYFYPDLKQYLQVSANEGIINSMKLFISKYINKDKTDIKNYLHICNNYLRSKVYTHAMEIFFAFYGINNDTKLFIHQLIAKYALVPADIISIIDLFNNKDSHENDYSYIPGYKLIQPESYYAVNRLELRSSLIHG